jgi:hypothetical protein
MVALANARAPSLECWNSLILIFLLCTYFFLLLNIYSVQNEHHSRHGYISEGLIFTIIFYKSMLLRTNKTNYKTL